MNINIDSSLNSQNLQFNNVEGGQSVTPGTKTNSAGSTGSLPDAPSSGSGVDKPNVKEPSVHYTIGQQTKALDDICSGVSELLILIAKLSQDERKNNRETIATKYEMVAQETLNSAEKLKESALSSLIGNLVSAGVQIAAGAVAFGLSAASISKAAKVDSVKTGELQGQMNENKIKMQELKNDMIAGKGDVGKQMDAYAKLSDSNTAIKGELRQMQNFDLQSRSLDAQSRMVTSMGQPLGNVAGSAGEYDAKMKEAESKKIEAQIQTLNATIDTLKSFNESLKELQSKSIETAASILRSETETIRSILS